MKRKGVFSFCRAEWRVAITQAKGDGMDPLKDQWNAEMALEVLKSETVHSAFWLEAVQWLVLYGPAHLKGLIEQASNSAFHDCFPDLKPAGFTPDGQPCYAVQDVAVALGQSEDEVVARMKFFEQTHSIQIIAATEVKTIQ